MVHRPRPKSELFKLVRVIIKFYFIYILFYIKSIDHIITLFLLKKNVSIYDLRHGRKPQNVNFFKNKNLT